MTATAYTECPNCGSRKRPTVTVRSDPSRGLKIVYRTCRDCDYSSWEPKDFEPKGA